MRPDTHTDPLQIALESIPLPNSAEPIDPSSDGMIGFSSSSRARFKTPPRAASTRRSHDSALSPSDRPDAQPEDPFDALTDLFLGDVKSAPAFAYPSSTQLIPAAEPSAPANLLDQTPADEPIAIASPVVAIAEETVEASTAISAAPLAPTPLPAPALIECIVLGHLPVLGSAWASQYVREVAHAAQRPIAVLRLIAGEIGVEFFNASSEAEDLSSIEFKSASAALAFARTHADRWIIRCDASDEFITAADPAVHMITLLTGADEAARIAAYTSIKQLAPRLPSSAELGPVVRIAMMGVEPDKAAAAAGTLAAAVRQFLNRDVQTAVCSSKIRSGRAARTLYAGAIDLALNTLSPIQLLTQDLPKSTLPLTPETTPSQAEHASPMLTPWIDQNAAEDVADQPEPATGVVEHADEIGDSSTFSTSSASSAPRPEMDVAHLGPIAPNVHANWPNWFASTLAAPLLNTGTPAGTLGPDSRPASSAQGSPKIEDRVPEIAAVAEKATPMQTSSAPVHAPDLSGSGIFPSSRSSSSHADHSIPAPLTIAPTRTPAADMSITELLPGLTAIAARCPFAPRVELALDAAGQLHALLLALDHPENGVSDLMVAASWAEAHAPLLLGPQAAAIKKHATLHLITPAPKSARRLLETPIRIHALASVDSGDQRRWCVVDLN